jgi:hypothetical protein
MRIEDFRLPAQNPDEIALELMITCVFSFIKCVLIGDKYIVF